MALTRKFLTALGIDAEKIDEIIAAHSETVNALKTERDGYKEDAEKLPGVQKELDDLKANQSNDNGFEKKYNDVKKEFDDYKKDVNARELLAKKKDLYKAALKKAGISDKHLERIMKASVDMIDGLEVDDKGEVKDSDALDKSVKEEWSDFITTEGQNGAKTSTPPASGGDGTGASRVKAIADKYYKTMYGGEQK